MAKKYTFTEEQLQQLIDVEVESSMLQSRLSSLAAQSLMLKGVTKPPPQQKSRSKKRDQTKPPRRTLTKITEEQLLSKLDKMLSTKKATVFNALDAGIRGAASGRVQGALDRMIKEGTVEMVKRGHPLLESKKAAKGYLLTPVTIDSEGQNGRGTHIPQLPGGQPS